MTSKRLAVVGDKGMTRDYDFMIRCYSGHFIADARSLGPTFVLSVAGMADAFCKGCKRWVPVDNREQLARLRMAFRAESLA